MKKAVYKIIPAFYVLMLLFSGFSFAKDNLSGQNQSNSDIKTINIYCSQDSFKYIYDNPLQDYYIHVAVEYDGQTWPSIPMRIRGDSSRGYPKKSLKLQFPEKFDDWGDTINLNAEYRDLGYFRSTVSSRLYRDTGHPCFRTEHFSVYLNGEYLGLYVRIENIDNYFLKHWDLDVDGNLYKAYKDGACLSVYDDVEYHWEKKTNKSAPFTDLKELIRDINTVKDGDFYQFLQNTFDYKSLINAFAVNMMISNGSTYYHNYYLYHDTEKSNKWMYLPWDMDLSLSPYGINYAYHRSSGMWTVDNPLLERAILCTPVLDDIQTRIDELAATWINSEHVTPIMDSLAAVIQDDVSRDTTDNVESLDVWTKAIDNDKAFISSRYAKLKDQFAYWPSSFRINPQATVFHDSVHFNWYASQDPNNNPITYTLYYSKSKSFSSEPVFMVENITDTLASIATPTDKTTYYWYVTASNPYTKVPGFDTYNAFTIKDQTPLNPEITNDITLTKENSPYYVNQDITVHENAILYIEQGAEIVFDEATSLTIKGNIIATGSLQEPIQLKSNTADQYWSGIYLDTLKDQCIFSNIQFINCFHWDNTETHLPVISANNTNLLIQDASFINCSGGISASGNKAEIKNCSFTDMQGKAIRITNCLATILDNNIVLKDSADAIILENADNSTIQGNSIKNSGIYITNDSKNIYISQNRISSAPDYGIKISDHSTAMMDYNILEHAQTGITVQDSSNVIANNNTLVNNNISFSALCVNHSLWGGVINISNTIISGSVTPVYYDEKSDIQISYTLCDTKLLSGQGNLYDDPRFASENDYSLLPDSPCIHAGNPNFGSDNDGFITDMGAVPYMSIPKIVINEINYHSSNDFDSKDWVEFYNADSSSINISNWTFQDENYNTYTFPNNTILGSNAYLVLCQDTLEFESFYPDVTCILGNMDFGLNNGGELLSLYNLANLLVDSVRFDDKAPWPVSADGKGATLELLDPDSDNGIPESWSGRFLYGSPGRTNNQPASESKSVLYQNYPNPFYNKTTIRFSGETKKAEITIFNILGQKVESFYPSENENTVIWDGSTLPSGIYFYRLEIDNKHINTIKAIHLK